MKGTINKQIRAQVVLTAEELDRLEALYVVAETPAGCGMTRGHKAIRAKFRAARLAIEDARAKHQ